jgi:hypothetical protein
MSGPLAESLEFTNVTPPMPVDEYGYGLMVVAPLSFEARKQAYTITDEIDRRLGLGDVPEHTDPVLNTPHHDITLARILEMGQGKTEEYWAQKFIGALRIAVPVLGKMASGIAPIPTVLDALKASPQAIIAHASEPSQPVADLRQQIISGLDPYPQCQPKLKHKDFVHTTLARYNIPGLPMADVRRVVAEVATLNADDLPLRPAIGKLVLAKETEKYHLVTVAEFPLAA